MILVQHHEQRQMFALLDDLRDGEVSALEAVWKRLTILLEVHAEAEEKFFYPRLLSVGEGAADADSVESETKDAIKDHNEIRDAIREADKHSVDTEAWWKAVTKTRITNGDHMAEEERQDLADFRRHASLDTRHEIAVQFVTFESQHADGIAIENKNPKTYVSEHR